MMPEYDLLRINPLSILQLRQPYIPAQLEDIIKSKKFTYGVSMKNVNRKANCWEFKKCGRQEGGEHARFLGVCPSSTEKRLDGVHGGTNAGRACWVVTGTYCRGETQGTFAQKFISCVACDFYLHVKKGENQDFQLAPILLRKLG
jgi:hypothetical protein